MAQQVHAMIVKVAEVYHHREFNAARPSGDYGKDPIVKQLKESLIRDGWWFDSNGTTEVVPITEEWKERAVKDLTERWEKLKEESKTNPNVLPEKEVFENVRTKNGKLIVPKYMGNTGNRRASVLDAVNLARYTAKEGGGSGALITEIPVIVQTYATEIERMVAQARENMGKNTGFSKPSDSDQLLSAKMIMEKGGTQSDVRRAFTGTTGQKLWGIITLDKRFPEVKLLERLTKVADTDPTHLDYGPIKGNLLPNMVKRSNPKDLANENAVRLTKGEPPFTPLTAEGLETFLGTKGTNAKKIMERTNIDALAQNSSNVVIKSVAQAIMDNNTDVLNSAIANATAINAVMTLSAQGHGPDVEAILLQLTKAPDVNVAIGSVKKALKV